MSGVPKKASSVKRRNSIKLSKHRHLNATPQFVGEYASEGPVAPSVSAQRFGKVGHLGHPRALSNNTGLAAERFKQCTGFIGVRIEICLDGRVHSWLLIERHHACRSLILGYGETQ